MLFHTTSAQFQEIEQKKGYILLDFYASWCMPCRELEPVLDRCSDELEEILTAYSINTDTDAVLSSRYSVDILPTVILLKDGKEVQRWERPEHECITTALMQLAGRT